MKFAKRFNLKFIKSFNLKFLKKVDCFIVTNTLAFSDHVNENSKSIVLIPAGEPGCAGNFSLKTFHRKPFRDFQRLQ